MRIVLRGYHMMPGVDYNETHAPVARLASIRLLCALAAKYNLELNVHDCVTAFLTPAMDTEVYVTLPAAFNNDKNLQPEASQSCTVHRLLKGVPGIPQGSRLFNDYFNNIMTVELGFTRLPGDYCIYHKPGQRIFIAIWVDDVLSAHPASEQAYMDSVFATLKKHVRLHQGGPAQDYLAFRINRDRTKQALSLDQSDAVKALLVKTGMEDCHPATTPVATSMVFTKQDCPSDVERADMVEEQAWYRSVLASSLSALDPTSSSPSPSSASTCTTQASRTSRPSRDYSGTSKALKLAASFTTSPPSHRFKVPTDTTTLHMLTTSTRAEAPWRTSSSTRAAPYPGLPSCTPT